MCWRIELKTDKNSGVLYLSNISRVQGCGTYQNILSKVKNNMLLFPLLQPKRSTTPAGPLWIFQATYSSSGCVTLTCLPSDPYSCQFWVGPSKREGSVTGPGCFALCSPTWTIWFHRSDAAWSANGREGSCLQSLAGPCIGITSQALGIREQKPAIFCG